MLTVERLNFSSAIHFLEAAMVHVGKVVDTGHWQGVKVNTVTHELQDVLMNVKLDHDSTVMQMHFPQHHWANDIKPNLPWADDHFLERVGGEPLNPGEQWKNWPWSNKADTFRTDTKFNHTYMERLWPKYARRTEDGKLPVGSGRKYPTADRRPKMGIESYYGDLQDLVELLAKEPYTRQAYLPLYFPEDTGAEGRKPCTLGYQFTVRDGRMNLFYPMRSCDIVRHFRDDCYLAVCLLLWVLAQCRKINPGAFTKVVPGDYSMWMTSLHCFPNDIPGLIKGGKSK